MVRLTEGDVNDALQQIDATAKSTVLFKKDAVVYRAGQPANSIFYLQTGRIKIQAGFENRKTILHIVEPGTFFSLNSLMDDSRSSTATAMSPSVVIEIAKTAVLSMIERAPVANVLVLHILRRAARAEDDVIDQRFNTNEQRLARLLALLASVHPGAPQISADVTQEVLAEMLGATRPQISTIMTKFRKAGLIEYNGSGVVTVHTKHLLDAIKPAIRNHRG